MDRSVVPTSVRWLAAGQSVLGASHERNGKPNQDALSIQRLSDGGGIVAVADGHGSAKHFRSDTGSRLAVAVAQELLEKMVEAAIAQGQPVEKVRESAKTVLPNRIVEEWRRRVVLDLDSRPRLSDAEVESLQKAPAAQEAFLADPYLAYGCTLLAAAATPQFLVLLQNGDGDIVCVSRAGKTWRPLPEDSRLIANETTSLCQPQAAQNFRVEVISFQDDPENLPVLLTLSSDGCANSYEEDQFLHWVEHFSENVSEYGLEPVCAQLPQWLEEMTRGGSGDDVTLGVLALEKSAGQTRLHESESLQAVQSPLTDRVTTADAPAITADTPAAPEADADLVTAWRDSHSSATATDSGVAREQSAGTSRRFYSLLLFLVALGVLALAVPKIWNMRHEANPAKTIVSHPQPPVQGQMNLGSVRAGGYLMVPPERTHIDGSHPPPIHCSDPHLTCRWIVGRMGGQSQIRIHVSSHTPAGKHTARITIINPKALPTTIPITFAVHV